MKRKITSYYKSKKKAKGNGSAMLKSLRTKGYYVKPSFAKRMAGPSYRSRRTRRKKPRTSAATKQLVSTTNIQTAVFDNNDEFAVPVDPGIVGAVDSLGKACCYGVVGVSSSTIGHVHGLLGIFHMQNIALLLDQNTGAGETTQHVTEQKINIIDGYQTSDIVNNSNGPAILTAYKVRCRIDVPQNGTTNYINIFNIMGEGFYQRGIINNTAGVNAPFSSNQGMYDAELSPFDSHRFCSQFQIIKQVKSTLDPGMKKTFTVRTGRKIINYNHYGSTQSTGANALTQAQDVAHRKGEMFWFYKLEGLPAPATESMSGASKLTYTTPVCQMITKSHYNFCAINTQFPLITKVPAQGYTVTKGQQIINEMTDSVTGGTRIV